MTRARLLDPSSSIAVVLGASDWSNAGLAHAPSFRRSAERFREYLAADPPRGLGLAPELTISLFDDPSPNGEQLGRVLRDVKARVDGRGAEGRPIRDVLIYYVGHGTLDAGADLHLLVRHTADGIEAPTSIAARRLAEVLHAAAPQQRRLVILDCCFSEAAVKDFAAMGPLEEAVAKEAANALSSDGADGGQPNRGTVVLCSSSKGRVSIGPPEAERTLFTGALVRVLEEGVAGFGPMLSFAKLHSETSVRMEREASGRGRPPRPVLHQPDQEGGDLLRVAAFPNPAAERERAGARRLPATAAGALDLKLVSWNVRCGVFEAGGGTASPVAPDFDYVARCLKKVAPDVVCLQEVLVPQPGEPSYVDRLSRATGLRHCRTMPLSPAHLVGGARMGLAVLCRDEIVASDQVPLPNPGLSARNRAGEVFYSHDKGFLRVRVRRSGRTVTVICGHLIPFHIFGVTPTDPRLRELRRAIGAAFLDLGGEPVVVGADLNLREVSDILPSDAGVRDLFRAPTRDDGRQTDHVLASPHWSARAVWSLPTRSDHHMCVADISLSPPEPAPAAETAVAGQGRPDLLEVGRRVGRRLAEALLEEPAEDGEPLRVGWGHKVDYDDISMIATAYGLLIVEALGREAVLPPLARRLPQVVSSLLAMRTPDGGWKASSQTQIDHSLPEPTAWAVLALHGAGQGEEAGAAGAVLERVSAADRDPVLWQRVFSLSLVLRALARVAPESALVGKMSDALVRSAARAGDGKPLCWSSRTSCGLDADAYGEASEPSVVHTAYAMLALLEAREAFAEAPGVDGAPGLEIGDLAGARDWLLGQAVLAGPGTWANINERIARRAAGRRGETVKLEVLHYTTPWVVKALLLGGADVGHPALGKAVREMLDAERDGFWNWGDVRRPIWATYDALSALRLFALRGGAC